MSVVNFLNFKVNSKEFNTYEELVSLVNSIPEDDEYTNTAINYIGNSESFNVFFESKNPVGELSPREIGLINYLASLSNEIQQLSTKDLENEIPASLYPAIEGCIDLLKSGKLAEAEQGMDMYSPLISENALQLLVRIKKLTMLYQLVRIKYISSVQERVGFCAFAIKGKQIFISKPSYRLAVYNSI